MNDGITNFIRIGFALQQIAKAVFTYICFTVKNNFQTRIQEAIVPYQIFDKLMMEFKVPEDSIIGNECYSSTIRLGCFTLFMLGNQYATFKFCNFFFF